MTASKKAFDMARDGNVYSVDPIEEVCLVGGKYLPPEQQGPLDIEGDESHPLFDERVYLPLDPAKIANIDAYGVITPIQIAKLDGIAVVVAGRQRIRMARVVNRQRAKRGEPPIKVRAVVVRSSGNRLIGTLITENVRVEEDPVTRIAKAKRLLERGVSDEDAAITFGVSILTFRQWMQFEDTASDELKREVAVGRLGLSAAMQIARLKDPEKQSTALETLRASPAASSSSDAAPTPASSAKKASVRAARIAAKQAKGEKAHEGVSDKRTITKVLRAIEKMNHKNASEKTMAWWEGVEAALAMVIGEDEVNERLAKVLAEVRGE